jgi:hypothetical protein
LKNYIYPNQSNWEDFLYAAEFAYNARFHASIKMSPFEADIGFIPKSVPDHLFAKLLNRKTQREAFEFGKCQQLIMERAKQNLAEAQDRMAKYYNKNRPIQDFNIGDLVMLSTKNLDVEHIGIVAGGCRKLASLWIGPYKIIAKTTPDTYRVRLPLGLRLHNEFHTSLLKPYRRDDTPGRINKPNEGMISAGGHDNSHLVEAIVGHRKRGGKIFYYVKWLGLPECENSWEPVENLIKPVGHLLEDYITENKLRRSSWLK